MERPLPDSVSLAAYHNRWKIQDADALTTALTKIS